MPRRHGGALAGFVVAPLAAPVVLGAIVVGYRALAGGEPGILLHPLALLTMLEWLLVIGAPIAYTATVAVGVPAYLVLIQRGPLRAVHVLAIGILTGAITFFLLFYEVGNRSPLLVSIGGVMGGASSLVFWLLARRDNRRQHAR